MAIGVTEAAVSPVTQPVLSAMVPNKTNAQAAKTEIIWIEMFVLKVVHLANSVIKNSKDVTFVANIAKLALGHPMKIA